MRTNFFSFKYKMIIFSFLLVGTCLGTFLSYVLDYFESDKKAYLFEEAFRLSNDVTTVLGNSVTQGHLMFEAVKSGNISLTRNSNVLAFRVEDAKGRKVLESYNDKLLSELSLPKVDF